MNSKSVNICPPCSVFAATDFPILAERHDCTSQMFVLFCGFLEIKKITCHHGVSFASSFEELVCHKCNVLHRGARSCQERLSFDLDKWTFVSKKDQLAPLLLNTLVRNTPTFNFLQW